MTTAPTRRTFISAIAVAAAAGCAIEPAPASSLPTQFDVVFARYMEARDAYNNSVSDIDGDGEAVLEARYDAAYCAFRGEPPLTSMDFVRKYIGLFGDGAIPIEETRNRVADEARRLAGVA